MAAMCCMTSTSQNLWRFLGLTWGSSFAMPLVLWLVHKPLVCVLRTFNQNFIFRSHCFKSIVCPEKGLETCSLLFNPHKKHGICVVVCRWQAWWDYPTERMLSFLVPRSISTWWNFGCLYIPDTAHHLAFHFSNISILLTSLSADGDGFQQHCPSQLFKTFSGILENLKPSALILVRPIQFLLEFMQAWRCKPPYSVGGCRSRFRSLSQALSLSGSI